MGKTIVFKFHIDNSIYAINSSNSMKVSPTLLLTFHSYSSSLIRLANQSTHDPLITAAFRSKCRYCGRSETELTILVKSLFSYYAIEKQTNKNSSD